VWSTVPVCCTSSEISWLRLSRNKRRSCVNLLALKDGGPFNIVQRDDGKWAIGWYDDAPSSFNSHLDAARVANGDKPALVPVGKFRRVRIREVRNARTA
jgi:hypothetical protein